MTSPKKHGFPDDCDCASEDICQFLQRTESSALAASVASRVVQEQHKTAGDAGATPAVSRTGMEPAPVEVSRLTEEAKREAEAYAAAVMRAQRGSWTDTDADPTGTRAALFATIDRLAKMASTPASGVAPIDMVLFCPACGTQHIDAAEPDLGPSIDGSSDMPIWSNPPHRSHLCHACEHVWRPADIPTNGVAAVKTIGKDDSPIASPATDASEVPAETQVQRLTKALERVVECDWAYMGKDADTGNPDSLYSRVRDGRAILKELQCR